MISWWLCLKQTGTMWKISRVHQTLLNVHLKFNIQLLVCHISRLQLVIISHHLLGTPKLGSMHSESIRRPVIGTDRCNFMFYILYISIVAICIFWLTSNQYCKITFIYFFTFSFIWGILDIYSHKWTLLNILVFVFSKSKITIELFRQ